MTYEMEYEELIKKDVHVMPNGDIIEHVCNPICDCKPKLDKYLFRCYGKRLWIHNCIVEDDNNFH